MTRLKTISSKRLWLNASKILFNIIALLALQFAVMVNADDNSDNTTSNNSTSNNTASNNPDYDPLLAKQLDADEYGMKRYVIAFLKRGPNRDRSEQEAKFLQQGHMQTITRLAEAGKLVLAGPFFGDGELRGIYVFNVETIAQARALTESDPAIQAGSLTMELLPWYGSAALLNVNQLHKSIAKTLM